MEVSREDFVVEVFKRFRRNFPMGKLLSDPDFKEWICENLFVIAGEAGYDLIPKPDSKPWFLRRIIR